MNEGKRVKIATRHGVRYGVIHYRRIERRSLNQLMAEHQTATAVVGILIVSACILLGGLVEGARMAF
jgi:hypothetical protein|nr:MAG TPA: hypothetical protein [Caudoviricetes sp.]